MLKLGLILLAGLVLLWGATLWKAARHEARARAEFPPLGQFLTIDGHRLHYVMAGTGPDLVLIHGSSGNLRDFTFQLMDRLKEDYRVIAFDRPGLGYSDRLNGLGAPITQQAEILHKAATALGATNPIVLGQSYGGAVALAWGVAHPDATAALVLVAAPAFPWDTPLSPFYRVTSHAMLGPLAIPFITAWVPEDTVQRNIAQVFLPQDEPPGYADHFGVGLTLRRDALRANALQRRNLLSEITALAPRYGALTMPIELLHGTADTTVNLTIHSQRLAAGHPNAHLTALDGIGHMPHHVRPEDTIAAIHRAATRAGLRESP